MPSIPLISVIVPVYKAEGTLKACVESIQAQSLPEIEVILINDGSPDKSGELCDEYARTDERIKVIHKENGGVSSARNAGLEVARGKYIGFVDSDDRIEPEMYERLYAAICRENAEIAMCGIVNEDTNGLRSYVLPSEYSCGGGLDVSSALRAMLFCSVYGNGVCNKLFLREVFEAKPEIRYALNIAFGEDLLFLVQCVIRSQRVAYEPDAHYRYFVNQESATHDVSRATLSDFEEALNRLEPLLPPELKGYCQLNLANWAVQFCCYALDSGDWEFISDLKGYFKDALRTFKVWKKDLETFPLPYRMRLYFARVSFIGACRLWNIIRKVYKLSR